MHSKKLIAPIVITLLLSLYFIGYVVASFFISMSLILRIITIGIPFFLVGVSIFVLVERIKEIRSGEEDDLSKY